MNAELAQSLLAGWVAGAIAGMVSTAAIIVLVVTSAKAAARVPWSDRLPILGIVFANALTIVLTLLGLILGVLFHNVGGEDVATTFGLYVLGITFAIGALYVFVRGRVRGGEARVVLLCLVVTGVCFGVVLPWLGSIEV